MVKKVSVYNQRQVEGLERLVRVFDYGLSLTLACAFNEMLNAKFMVYDSPLYKQNFKKAINYADKLADRHYRQIVLSIKDRKFYDTYTDTVIDNSANDITLLRISLKQTLDSAAVENSDVVAQFEVASILLQIAIQQYQGVINLIKRDYGTCVGSTFSEFDVSDIYHAWRRVCEYTHKTNKKEGTVNLNTPRTDVLFRNLAEKFANGTYIEQGILDARKEGFCLEMQN